MATEGAVCTGRPAALPRPGKEAPEGRGLRWSPAPRACAFRCRCVAQADLLCCSAGLPAQPSCSRATGSCQTKEQARWRKSKAVPVRQGLDALTGPVNAAEWRRMSAVQETPHWAVRVAQLCELPQLARHPLLPEPATHCAALLAVQDVFAAHRAAGWRFEELEDAAQASSGRQGSQRLGSPSWHELRTLTLPSSHQRQSTCSRTLVGQEAQARAAVPGRPQRSHGGGAARACASGHAAAQGGHRGASSGAPRSVLPAA